MNKILIIATDFPPHKYIGRIRTTKFAKHLPQFNWKVFVLTPTSSYLWDKDDSLVKEIPNNINLYRAFHPIFLPVLSHKLFNFFLKNKNIKQSPSSDSSSSNKNHYKLAGLKKLL